MARVQASGAACLEVTVHRWPRSPFQPPLSLCLPRLLVLRTAHCRDHAAETVLVHACVTLHGRFPLFGLLTLLVPSTSPNFYFIT